MRSIRMLALVALLAPPSAACAELPSESALPGDGPSVAEFPGESELPSYVALQAPPIGGAPPQETEPPVAIEQVQEPQPPKSLPAEGDLPDADDDGQATAPDDGLPIKGSPDGIPWLRLNRPGHTAPLRAMTFSADGERLSTAGDDKSLVIWAKAPGRAGGPERWGYERTVRWQIQRGTRGRIYALAAGPEWVALAGEGAMAPAGEILLVDPASGELAAVLNDLEQGHRQAAVVALSMAPGGARTLASLSLDGCLVHWSQNEAGLWKATRLSGPDAELHRNDPALVQQLLMGRRLSAVAAINEREVVAATYARTQDNRIEWKLERYDATNGRHEPLAAEGQAAPHWDAVTAMAVSADGSRLASADGGGGFVYLWDLSATPARMYKFPPFPAPVTALAFDAAGRTIVLGGDVSSRTRRATVEVWSVADLAAPRRLASFESGPSVAACSMSADGQTVAWTAGSRAQIRQIRDAATMQTLDGGASPPLRVAFPAEQPYYRLGFGKRTAAGRPAPIDHVFDTNLLRLERLNQEQPAKWLPEDWLSKGWQVRSATASDGSAGLWFYEGTARRARIPLREIWEGAYRSVCWIPSREPGARPLAAAIGTSAGGIYVFRLTDDGVAPVVRQFRGHAADVTSLAVSLDLRYLASASRDGTIGVWPLSGLLSDEALVQRWGADFREVDGQLVAAGVRSEGPVYFRGMREGDRLTEVSYRAGDEDRVYTRPDEMRTALAQSEWSTQQVTFKFVRGRGGVQSFQLLPAWQQLVSLFAADDGEWAYWTPAGYYDASFEGHKLFGWQINRGLEMLPDFFLAAQFRRQLERPGAMSQLLRTGNLEAAFRAARLEAPVNSPEALVNSYRLKPEVEILSPRSADAVSGEVKLTARLSVDAAERLMPPKAFGNGVAGVNRRLLAEGVEDGRRRYTYEWDMSLPSDPRVLIEVAAATENEVTASDRVVVNNAAPPRAGAPRLFLLSVGVDDYQDAQIPKLTTAVQSTRDLLAVMQRGTARLYRLDAASLLEDRATKPSWRFLTENYAEELSRDVSPDDLLVVFLSGHGVQAPEEAGYQFVTADARYADVAAGRYGDCLSLADFSQFADVPCRKLVILNTCHGGAVQPLMHRELKSAVRALQDDVLITLAASGGEQEAVEGRFAKRLVEALGGAADGDGDGLVSLGETVAYVERTVANDSSGDAVRQAPSAGPKELLQYVTAPLTASERPPRVSARLTASRQRSK